MKRIFYVCIVVLSLCLPALSLAQVKGIYISQTTLEDKQRLTSLITRAKEVGINTLVVDFQKLSKAYQRNIELVKQSGLKYVARVVVFDQGGDAAKVLSEAYWDKRYQLMKQAIALGAKEIQLDYIRYSSKQAPSDKNAHDVTRVIKWYKAKMDAHGIPLQADVFGITGLREEKRIGQNLKMIGPHVNALCPMVYPSHYEPYKKHAVTPYETVYSSLVGVDKQFNNQRPFKLYPYIELFNYRYPLSPTQRQDYIRAQLKAVADANADGWFAWSANNYYDHLFTVLGADSQQRS